MEETSTSAPSTVVRAPHARKSIWYLPSRPFTTEGLNAASASHAKVESGIMRGFSRERLTPAIGQRGRSFVVGGHELWRAVSLELLKELVEICHRDAGHRVTAAVIHE